MESHLALGKFKMNLLEANAKNALLSLIEELEGTKTIIWDKELVGPVTVFRIMRRLTELGGGKMFTLEADRIPSTPGQHVIFIVKPGAAQMNLVAEFVHVVSREDHGRTSRKEFLVIFIPRATQMCERRLEALGVLGSIDIKSANFNLFPFDADLMSMEQEHTFREFSVEKDPTALMDVALALRELDVDYGPFPHILGRGPAAKIVADNYIQSLRLDRKKKINATPSVHHLILIDRQLDLITPLATQLTYEGLIDEMFGLNNTAVSLPPERFIREEDNEVMASPTSKLIFLNSSDDLYAELRDRNFNGIGPALRRKAKTVALQLEKRHVKTMESMKKFVSQLPQLQASKKALALHTTIAELIKEKTEKSEFLDGLQVQQELLCGLETDKVLTSVEDMISKRVPVIHVLRLICLQSLVNGGLKSRLIEHYKREIMQTYGLNLLIPLANLEKAGLLRTMSGPRHYAALKRTLHLINEDASEVDPTDIFFPHSIYAPLSVRLIENALNWGNMKDILDMVPGPTVDCTQGRIPATKPEERQLVLVFFIGGCTYSEVSALRFLSQKEDSNVEYVIATTKLINGNTFVKSVMMAEDYPDIIVEE